MDNTFRQIEVHDRALWAQLRAELWPDESVETHHKELNEFLERGNFWGFVAELSDGTAAGFAEVAIRDYANGSVSRPVAFLEGIWIRQQFRRPRLGARLLQTVESFLVSRGFAELGADAFIDDRESRHMRAGASRKRNASYIFVRTSIRLMAHDIAGATPHPSCSSEYGIRS
jgi:aminoglycoside 6'-N-acetyltransferase I